MKRVLLKRFGEPADVLEVVESEPLVPGPGEVKVRMVASPINPSDLMTVRGLYGKLPTLPATPGYEGIGIVESAGPGLLGKLLVRRRVAVLASEHGTWRQETLAQARQVVPLARSIPDDQGAMFFVNPATAYILTTQVLAVPPGETLVVTAAGSALGKMVIRLGRERGFHVIAVVRRDDLVDELKALGSRQVVVAEGPELEGALREATRGTGVRYAIECVGGETGSAVIAALGIGGRCVLYGTLSGRPVQFDARHLLTQTARIDGFWLARWMPALSLIKKIRLMRAVSSLMEKGILVSDVAEQFPLSRIADAVRAVERRARGGKFLLSLTS